MSESMSGYQIFGYGGQQMLPQSERALPQWQRDALERERNSPRNINDVLAAIAKLSGQMDMIQARLYMIEMKLGIVPVDKLG